MILFWLYMIGGCLRVLLYLISQYHRENIKGIAFMETFPFSFPWSHFPSAGFRIGFRMIRTPILGKFMVMIMNIFVNQIIKTAVARGLSKEIHKKYKEPFPTIQSRYPVWVMPNELPIDGRKTEAYEEIKKIEKSLSEYNFPMLLFTATPGGLIHGDKIDWFKKTIKDLTVKDIGAGIHYLQEDNPNGIASGIIEWSKRKQLV